MPFEGEIQEQLIAYTKKALDAVGLKNGPAHNEVMMTEKGPMLVEINARMGGSAAPILNRECVGRGQLDIMMDVLLEPSKFLSYHHEPYKIQKHGLAVYFISSDDKHTVNADAAEKIKALPSCYSLRLASPGTKLAKTVDMFTMPGMIELVSEDKNQLWKDYEFIRAQEESGHLYVLAGKP
ncbi:MAG: hypothetical protein H6623_05900 [Bdellovibrionaceae bacterium]|nr:hypothetical protein [Pseudobdellovibrionaceae bacterium]